MRKKRVVAVLLWVACISWFATGVSAQDLVVQSQEHGGWSGLEEAVEIASDFLSQASVDDRVILYFAGHGLLASDGNYCFAPTDMRFSEPTERGISFPDIETLLASTPARERVVFLDSCHAGENDRLGGLETVARPLGTGGAEGVVSTRGLARVSTQPTDAGLSDLPLLEDVFVDFRAGTGAHVIAASGAQEFALESSEWGNGVFTASVLHGLQSGEADLNGDSAIRVDELRRYVSERVSMLTENQQVPTSRRANLALDFALTGGIGGGGR